MSVRPHPTKSRREPGRHWHVDVYIDGNRKRYPFEGSFDEAKEFEAAIRQTPIINTLSPAPQIKDLILPFLKDFPLDGSPATARDMSNTLKGPILHTFGNLQPKQLSIELFNQYKSNRLEDGVTRRTINKEMSYLSSLISWAADNGHCQPIHFKIPRFSNKRTKAAPVKPLTPRQVDAVFKSIDPQYRLVLVLMSDAGLRKQEALNLKAEDIDENHRTMAVKGKGDKIRVLPWTTKRLDRELKNALDKCHSGPLTINPATGKPYDSIKKALHRAATKAGVGRKIGHHLFRHSFLTNAAEKGISPQALQQIAGHEDIQTTMKIYVNIRADYVRSEMEKLRE